MKKAVIIGLFFLFVTGLVFCDIVKDIKNADDLFDTYQYGQAHKLLLSLVDKAKGDKEKTDVYWRLARVTLYLGDEAEDNGKSKKEILEIFEKGEEFADKALEFDPENYLALYWKSSNMGRWGQVKGILDSLGKAGPMQKLLEKAININPEHADSYFVLGELYDELPGFPVSFGSIDNAVSLARKSIAIFEKDYAAGKEKKFIYGYYIKLAKHLEKRGWSASKRESKQEKKKKQYNKTSDVLKKNFEFEGTMKLKNISDKEEALEIINKVIGDLEKLSKRDKQQSDDLKDAKELKDGWK
ncbi:MAG: hypothetical protein JXJ04_25385 [Spirochaetales bacterium]|nr:hypothetical protein [Spirochaetales bacterium]